MTDDDRYALKIMAKPGVAFSAGPHTGLSRVFTLAQARKGMWPGPVYEGHFADGTIGRMSFWSKARKPLDFDRGRCVVTKCHLWCDKVLVDGWVEPPDAARIQDPFFNGGITTATPIKAQPRFNAKAARAAIADLTAALEALLADPTAWRPARAALAKVKGVEP